MNINFKKVLITTTAPTENINQIRNAAYAAGAGIIGNYSHCSISTECTGTFKPNENAHPYIGENNKLEYAEEEKLEIICDATIAKNVIAEIKKVHPYEEPGIFITPLLAEDDFDQKPTLC